MLETYKKYFCNLWEGLKPLLSVVGVILLPLDIMVAYMFYKGTPDIDWLAIVLFFAVNLMWCPIPMRWFFLKDKSYTEVYIEVGKCLGQAIAVCGILYLAIIWHILPVFVGSIWCLAKHYQLGVLEGIASILLTVIWFPFASHIYMTLFNQGEK